jgi:mono/diheme cytochrome c family protein
MPYRAAILALAAATLCSTAYAADPKPSADQGQILAARWCVRCHTIAKDQTSTVEVGAPSFPDIAARPVGDRKWVSHVLQAPHPPMPDLHLGRVEIADLIAYIESQR